METGKYSFGIGDRFSMQGEAQLKAIQKALDLGIEVIPVWNKSYREHKTIHSHPILTRKAADDAVNLLDWKKPYFVDADHINMNNVDIFLDHCDYFTIDVADYIGKPACATEINDFVQNNKRFVPELIIPGIKTPFEISVTILMSIAQRYLYAVKQAGVIYRHIESQKGTGNFVAEISMDEVSDAQTPIELFFILQMIAQEGIPAHTIAPKFSGCFNKGVDYVGDIESFEREFEYDLLVIDLAIKEFGLPSNIKLSVHSGSDKFSIYPILGRLIRKYDKGIHIKTAGTTWLEEVIGFSMVGGKALDMVKEIYAGSLKRFDELCDPYALVIDIDKTQLPTLQEVQHWDGETLAHSLRHIPSHPLYNPHFRQLMHVSYKLAAELKNLFTDMVTDHAEIVGQQVTENIFDRHLKRLFEL